LLNREIFISCFLSCSIPIDSFTIFMIHDKNQR
jgi:hypothetical protein